jgi:biotin transport system substrate-specific component
MPLRSIIHIALFAAIIAALGLVPKINVPFGGGVPITAQSMGVMLAGVILGARHGALSMLLFLFLVALGLPLLSGGRGGLGVFASPSAGYLIGFVPGAYVTGLVFARLRKIPVFWNALIAATIGGVGIVHALGIPVQAWRADLTLWQAFVASLVFLPGSLIKVLATAFIAETVKRTMPSTFNLTAHRRA